MTFDCPDGDHQLASNFLIRLTACEKPKHIELAVGEWLGELLDGPDLAPWRCGTRRRRSHSLRVAVCASTRLVVERLKQHLHVLRSGVGVVNANARLLMCSR